MKKPQMFILKRLNPLKMLSLSDRNDGAQKRYCRYVNLFNAFTIGKSEFCEYFVVLFMVVIVLFKFLNGFIKILSQCLFFMIVFHNRKFSIIKLCEDRELYTPMTPLNSLQLDNFLPRKSTIIRLLIL